MLSVFSDTNVCLYLLLLYTVWHLFAVCQTINKILLLLLLRTWDDDEVVFTVEQTAYVAQSVVGDLARPAVVDHHVVAGQVAVELNTRLVQVFHSLCNSQSLQLVILIAAS